jgi:ankyrin repeat protein
MNFNNFENMNSHAIAVMSLECSQLHESVYMGKFELTKLLLARTQQLSFLLYSRDPRLSNTPLHWACMIGCLQGAFLLIQAGANFLLQNFEGKTPLHYAVASGCVELVQFLLQIGAKATIGDIDGATPVHYAAVSSPPMLQIFQQNLPVNELLVVDHDGDSPLHWACREGRLDLVQELAHHYPNLIYFTNQDGESALDIAQKYDEQIYKFLQPNKQKNSLQTTFSTSISFGGLASECEKHERKLAECENGESFWTSTQNQYSGIFV